MHSYGDSYPDDENNVSRLKTVHRSIEHWFLFFDQTLMKIFSAELDEKVSTGPWLKNHIYDQVIVVSGLCALVYRYLTSDHQTLTKIFLPDFDFVFSINLWFQNIHRDHDRDWKPFADQSGFDFTLSITIWLKTWSRHNAETIQDIRCGKSERDKITKTE